MSIRTRRIGHEIRRIISELLERGEIHDPRLLVGMITITDVTVTADLHSARVFFSCLGSLEEIENVKEGFNSAATRIQTEVGKELRIKFTPKLTFEHDKSIAYGDYMERVLETLNEDEPEDADN